MLIRNKAGRLFEVSKEKYQQLKRRRPKGYFEATPEQEAYYKRLWGAKDPNLTSVYFPYWESPLKHDGYGGSAIEMMKHDHLAGLHLEHKYNGQDIALVYHMPATPERFYREEKAKLKPNTKIVAFTMWETSELPERYVKSLEYADAIIVPCQWNKDMYQKQLPDKDIYVVPLGINMLDFPYKERKENKGKYKFLMYNGGNKRKGFPEYLDAFIAEFKEDEDVEFVVKTWANWSDRFFSYGKYMNKTKGRNIKLVTGELTRQEQLELLYNHDCFVFPSKGEGFSLPPIEAGASGMPVILTEAHAHLSFKSDAFYWVDTVEEPSEIEPRLPKMNLPNHPDKELID